nr:interferon lambda receptor 1 isoform X2 [Pogona vitticeps]
MTVAFWAILFLLMDCSFQEGMLLLPPQNVTLISENFYTFLIWHPAPGSTSNTQYEVERHNGNRSSPGWVKETSCRGNNLKVIQSCQLHLPDLYTHYYARVRAQDGSRWSDWANSNTLQLYKDIIGPLNLSLVVADHDLTVSVSMPQTPLKTSENLKVMKVLRILVALQRENKTIQKVMVGYKLGRMNHTFENIKPNVNYCVQATVVHQPAKEAVQCIKCPDDVWTPFVIASLTLGGFILLGAVGGAVSKHHLQTSEIVLPQSLTFLNTDRSALRAALPLDGDSPSLSAMCFFSHHRILNQQERGQIQFIPGSCNTQRQSIYCANVLRQAPLGDRDSALLSGAFGDTSSSGESLGEEYLTEVNSRTAPEHFESSLHSSPATGGLHPHGMRRGSRERACEMGSQSEQMRWTSLPRADVPLDSLKLQNVLDLQGLVQDPGTYLPLEGCRAYSGTQLQRAMESLACQEQCGLSKDREGPHDSRLLEGRDAHTRRFPGYESRPPILF